MELFGVVAIVVGLWLVIGGHLGGAARNARLHRNLSRKMSWLYRYTPLGFAQSERAWRIYLTVLGGAAPTGHAWAVRVIPELELSMRFKVLAVEATDQAAPVEAVVPDSKKAERGLIIWWGGYGWETVHPRVKLEHVLSDGRYRRHEMDLPNDWEEGYLTAAGARSTSYTGSLRGVQSGADRRQLSEMGVRRAGAGSSSPWRVRFVRC